MPTDDWRGSQRESTGREDYCAWKMPDRTFGVGTMKALESSSIGTAILALLIALSIQVIPAEESSGRPEAAVEAEAPTSPSCPAPTHIEQ